MDDVIFFLKKDHVGRVRGEPYHDMNTLMPSRNSLSTPIISPIWG